MFRNLKEILWEILLVSIMICPQKFIHTAVIRLLRLTIRNPGIFIKQVSEIDCCITQSIEDFIYFSIKHS